MKLRRQNYFDRSSDFNTNRLDEIISLQWGIINSHIHLIASACYPFPSVLRALSEPSFVLPAEGMPLSRYLPGSKAMDIVEVEGEKLALRLFGYPVGYKASLQPHSGTQANQIVYNSVLEPDDTVLCLKPKKGGHISHSVLISRRHKTVNYELTQEGYIDYDNLEEVAVREKPKLIIVGGSSLSREIDFERCFKIARKVNAFLHADISHTATFIAANVHKPVFPYCDFVTFNTVKNLRGPNSGILIYKDKYTKEVHSSIFPTTQGGANETNMLGKFAALLEWCDRDISSYAKSIIYSARLMGDVLMEEGINLTSNGTDCHILLVDLKDSSSSGAELERKMEELGVLINKNLTPNDKRSPLTTSGLRIGTTNLAILNYEDKDLIKLAKWIANIINNQSTEIDTIRELIHKYNVKIGKQD
ncbi:serine hydroxymethyltransferase [Pseudoalteromonas rubra]|uniref:Serine hydroxymethyltransferase-like domain-containing protein n=1 Tax=Pseudoalteromonas rubra TaxID=43658 RepID=A0A0F4QGT3_9GAMM|nr:aminotransferase class V-fold PLP-dependent enzyme [Pseudoalteromonas rubra]KJZ06480.1 hypothetical protein TW77_19105 [Pseudoalteromonas rubra]